jgi:ankyrin repeat protein
LIVAGATVNCRVTEDLSTPLHKACAGNKPGHLNCVLQLLSSGADVHALNKWKETPLLTAANHGQAGTVGALLNAGADPCKCTDTGWSPLSIAAYKGHDEVVLLLLEKGAPTEEEDPTLSALLQAATKGLPSTVEILLRHGADHSVTTKKGDTALSILVEQNLIDIAAEMVTEYKASVPRCSRDRKKVQRARLLINLRVKQQQRECSLSLDSDDYSDQDDSDYGSNEALHDSGGSPSSGPVVSKKKKGLGRLSFEKSIENAEAEAKAAAEALLLELEQEDAQAQKDELAANSKKSKKKKKKMKDRLVKLEEDRIKKEKELMEEEERNRLRRLQEEKEREQRDKERRLEEEMAAIEALKRKEKEDTDKKSRKESAKANRVERKALVENGKQSSPREDSQNTGDKKTTTISKAMSPFTDNISSPASKNRTVVVDQPIQLLLPKSPKHSQSTLLPRTNNKIFDDQSHQVASSNENFMGRAASLASSRDYAQIVPSSPTVNRSAGGIEHPSISLFRREKVSELLNRFSMLPLSSSNKVNPLSLFDSSTIRSIFNKWIIRASQSSSGSIDPLIPSWQDTELLETFFQRQFISESQRSYSKQSSIRMEAAKEAGNTLTKACLASAAEVLEYSKKIEQHFSGNWSDTALNISAKDISLNASPSKTVVIDWSGRSQVYLPLELFKQLRSRFCGPSHLFLTCVFNLMIRYSTRRDIVSGTSWEYRLPPSTIDVLQRELKVSFELISEPLFVQQDNMFFGLFNDMDWLFGGFPGFGGDRDDDSQNTIWENGVSTVILTGSDSHSTAVHLRKILNILEQNENNGAPLSFALFVVMEGLRDSEGTATALEEFNVVRSWFTDKQLKYIRCFELLPAGQYSYAVGDADGHNDTPSQNSVFILLQNDMGYERFYLRADTCQNILATLIAPMALPTKATMFNISQSADRAMTGTPLSLTPVPSSPTSNFVQGLVMDDSMSDPIGLTKRLDPAILKTTVTPVPSLGAVGNRRRERLFQLVDDGDDAEDLDVEAHSDVVSGMLRNLQNSSRFLREHESSDHVVDIEAISLMGILSPANLGFEVEDRRGNSNSGSRMNPMNLRSSF